jgi:hypothetical protein
MNAGNFNWFLHTMLFMHTMNVIEKQETREKGGRSDDDSDDEAEVEIDDHDHDA